MNVSFINFKSFLYALHNAASNIKMDNYGGEVFQFMVNKKESRCFIEISTITFNYMWKFAVLADRIYS